MKKMICSLGTGLLVLVLTSLAFAAPVALQLDRSAIEISTFYNGSTVQATGTVPAGSEAVVRVSGKEEELHLKKKGKVAGLLWMNTGDLTIEHAPRIYMLYASAAGKDALTDQGLGIGLASLRDTLRILPESEDQGLIFREFLKLKQHDGIYAEYPGSVTYSGQPGGDRQFRVSLQIPPRMSEDDYTIEVMAVNAGRVIGRASSELQVKMVGFPEQLSRLAFHRGTLYGVLSVLVAVAAGFLMGGLFRGKGGAH